MFRDRNTVHGRATRTRLGYRPRQDHGGVGGFEELIDVPPPFDWTPTVLTFLRGARDAHSPLSLLRGQEQDIIPQIISMLKYEYKEGAVTLTPPAYAVARLEHLRFGNTNIPGDSDEEEERETMVSQRGDSFPLFNALIPQNYQIEPISRYVKDRPQIAFSPVGNIRFPDPADINVNMMPFIMGNRHSLPTELWPYYDQIVTRCPVHESSEHGNVMYLTVQEGFVEASKTQRRPGLHVEAPGRTTLRQSGEFLAGLEHRWGMGMAYTPDELKGGLYIASNMSNSTAVWDALVDSKLGAVDTHGGIEHLRPYIGKGKRLPANLLVWMTDRTPHEALPQVADGYRQFFRLVTADISVWYAADCTPNPKVPVPSHVKIIGESKFSSNMQEHSWRFEGTPDLALPSPANN